MEGDDICNRIDNALKLAKTDARSRELSLVITKLEEARMWRVADLELKAAAQEAARAAG